MTNGDPIASVTFAPNSLDDPEDMQWHPQLGIEISTLLSNKLDGQPLAQARVAASSRAILGRGTPPRQPGSDTGLVVGYVQSGKTLSFTAVMALARDNGFQLIVVIAGSSTQLADQSQKRIRKDLRIDADHRRAWAPYHNPRNSDAEGIQRFARRVARPSRAATTASNRSNYRDETAYAFAQSNALAAQP